MMDTWDKCLENPGETMHWELLKASLTAAFLEVLIYPIVQNATKEERDLEIIRSTESYICTHLNENLNVCKVARVAGYSPLYFRRLYFQCRGENIHKFITRQRLIHAQKQLQNGLTAEAVAAEVGVSSAAYFTRFFKKHLLMTPSEWRAQHSISMS